MSTLKFLDFLETPKNYINDFKFSHHYNNSFLRFSFRKGFVTFPQIENFVQSAQFTEISYHEHDSELRGVESLIYINQGGCPGLLMKWTLIFATMTTSYRNGAAHKAFHPAVVSCWGK